MKASKEDSSEILELCALDREKNSPAEITERPVWERVSVALTRAYRYGGFVDLRVVFPSGLVEKLNMTSLPGQYRLTVLTGSDDPKEKLLEWWEEGDSGFRGVIRFGDDDWDSRTVCSDISIAENIFKELFILGDLSSGLLQMRSQWNPKP